MNMRKTILFICCMFVLSDLVGCEAFVRKFSRKSKKDQNKTVEMVLAPQEYKAPQVSKEELYRRYFMFWQSWHDELINALSFGSSVKKQLDCLNEAIKNLMNMRDILNDKKRAELDSYLKQMGDLKNSLERDIYGNDAGRHLSVAENIRRSIWHEFLYSKVKDSLL